MKETLRWFAANANEIAEPRPAKEAPPMAALDSERAGRIHAALQMAQSEDRRPPTP